MSTTDTTTTTEAVAQIPLDRVRPDPDQPRTQFDKAELRALADDIKARGIIQPVTLRPDPADADAYIIVYGERRYRAAKLAKLPTLRAIVEHGERDPLDRYIDQAAENIQRDDLKPMEMANFFNTLHTTHGVKLSEIPALLKARGLRRIERPYISNLRRLVDLPPWAQDMINAEQLTPAHGKYLLYARELDAVLDLAREEIEWHLDEEQGDGRAPTISELVEIITDAFTRCNYPDLYHLHHHANGFDPENSCKGCKHYRRISGYTRYHSDSWFCLGAECFANKSADHHAQIEAEKKAQADAAAAERRQADAARRKAAAQTTAPDAASTPSASDHGTGNPVDDAIAEAMASSADDQHPPQTDVWQSQQTPEQSAPAEQPDHPEQPDQAEQYLTDQQRRLRDGRIEKTERYLDDWLRAQLREHLADDEATRYSILLWVGAGSPGFTVNGGYYSTMGVEILLGDNAIEHGIDYTLRQIDNHEQILDRIIDQTLAQLDRRNLRRLAHYCGTSLDDYQLDREYLAIKSNIELIEATPERVRASFDDWPKAINCTAGELVDKLLARGDAWGTPDDLRAMYAAFAPKTVSQETQTAA